MYVFASYIVVPHLIKLPVFPSRPTYLGGRHAPNLVPLYPRLLQQPFSA